MAHMLISVVLNLSEWKSSYEVSKKGNSKKREFSA